MISRRLASFLVSQNLVRYTCDETGLYARDLSFTIYDSRIWEAALLDHLELDPTLLDADRSLPEAPSDFAACLNAHGTYSTIHFVLRLSPRVHQLIDAIPSRIYAGGEIDGETIQAYSTYLH